jgi:hypothetical protein
MPNITTVLAGSSYEGVVTVLEFIMPLIFIYMQPKSGMSFFPTKF